MTDDDNSLLILFFTQLRYAVNLVTLLVSDHGLILQCQLYQKLLFRCS